MAGEVLLVMHSVKHYLRCYRGLYDGWDDENNVEAISIVLWWFVD